MDAFAKMAQFFSSDAGKGVMTAGTAGAGLTQNWLAQREAHRKQQFVEDLITNPAKLQKFVAGFNQPLSAGLTADVARSTDAYGAERGLGSSPAIMKDVYAQALAPYVEQQKQAAMQAALQSLGIYADTPTTKPADVTSLFKALQMSGSPAPTAAPASPPIDFSGLQAYTSPLPDPYVGDTGIIDAPAIAGQ